MRASLLGSLLIVAVVLGTTSTAEAIPAFARRYGTTCQTCHTVFPKLSPFGEAFRRNGFKFPGRDEEFVKQEQIPLGQEAYREVFPNAVWPGTLPIAAPLALGFNGAVTIHPTKSSSAALADNKSVISLQNLVEEGHLWAGGAFSEHIAYFGEVTFVDGGAEIEHAELHFNDLGLSPHLVNLYVGRGVPNLTSFGPHSSYIADSVLPTFGVTALFGGDPESAFSTLGQYNLVELNGMAKGRFIYSIGVNSGANLIGQVHNSENVTGHVGFKLGGTRLDGEGDKTGDPLKPWAETALTVDLYGYRSVSNTSVADDPTMPFTDKIWVLGGHVRGTAGSFELDAGVLQEWHSQAVVTGGGVKALAQYDELSYVVYPWLVPAVRLEYLSLLPDGGSRINDLRVLVGGAALVRPNLKLTLVGAIEHANTAPVAGWSADGSDRVAAPTSGAVTEFESIELGLAYAF